MQRKIMATPGKIQRHRPAKPFARTGDQRRHALPSQPHLPGPIFGRPHLEQEARPSFGPSFGIALGNRNFPTIAKSAMVARNRMMIFTSILQPVLRPKRPFLDRGERRLAQ